MTHRIKLRAICSV